jgi:signal transduction histidine kinase/CheY-like chemotaxis protein
VGFSQCEPPLAQSICAHAIQQPGLCIIADLAADPRTRDNPLVTEGQKLRFYAGARLETREGTPLGTVCVIDTKPRPAGLSAAQADSLRALARQVMAQLDARVVHQKQGQTLTSTQNELRQSYKMDALGQLTGGIAHDFNNLLTGIIGSLDLVRRRMAANRPGDIPRFLDAASTSANRAAALTHRLLAFARQQPLDSKPSDVNRLLGAMEELLHRTLGKGVVLQTALASDLWLAAIDANQFENAVLNLAINARDAMPDGGLLTIETENTALDSAYATQHDDVVAGDYVAISVSDTGSGMPAAVIERAFDPFFTTKPIGAGTGLGLSMVFGFIKQSGGHIQIYSEEGKGTTVRMYLAVSHAILAAADSMAVIDTPRATGECVLVVEDEPTVRQLMTTVLEELGYSYLVAPDAATAIALLKQDRTIDLLMTDVGLPIMNGRQLAEIARLSRPDLKVLFVTGYAANAAVRGEFLAPGMDMLTKPFTLDALGNKIRQMLDRPDVELSSMV